jgi:hypothetical protein
VLHIFNCPDQDTNDFREPLLTELNIWLEKENTKPESVLGFSFFKRKIVWAIGSLGILFMLLLMILLIMEWMKKVLRDPHKESAATADLNFVMHKISR